MSESGKNTDFRMQLIDKLIVGLIGFASLAVIVVTIFVVNHKYRVLYEKQLEKLDEIPYNDTYRYMRENNSIKFYKSINVVSEYKCLTDCKVTSFLSNQFIIDNDDLIPVYDNNKVMLYSVKNNMVKLILDDVPQTSINNQFGIIKIDNKSGVLDKKGNVILDCIYSDIDINISHIVALMNGVIYIFDNNVNLILTRTINTVGDLSISEKNNYMYINIIGLNTVILIFDSRTNTFVN